MRGRSTLFALALLVASCTPTRWDGSLARSGSLDLALRPVGVSLMDATAEHTYGLGVLESAAGVAIAIDGQVAIGRAMSATHARTDPGFAPGMGASWMVRARIPRWREVILHEALDFEGLARRVAELARRENWPEGRPLLFVVEGPLEAVSASIVRGARPGVEPEPGREPFRTYLRQSAGTLVGVHAPGGGGLYVLPGDELRIHAWLREPVDLVCTLDAARVLPGARLRVPAR